MIRITRQSDYGIVLLAAFAAKGGDSVRTARDLAAETHVPLPMVGKILKALARGGVLASHRGAKGGYSLARPVGAITIADVIRALEGPIAITECLDDEADTCGIERLCPVRTNWDRINRAIRRALEEIPISDMLRPITFPARRALHEAARVP